MKTKLDFTRQLDIIVPEQLNFPVTLIGAGGIGSLTALALAKMGVRDLKIYDHDTVSDVNIPNQFYPLSCVGRPKVEALAQLLEEFAGITPKIVPGAFTGEGERLVGVVLSAVDTLESRRTIWTAVRLKPTVSLYVDARMGAEVALVYAVRPSDIDDIRFYEGTLHADQDSFEAPCTARSVIYNVLSIASLVANQVKKHARGEPVSREIICDLKNLVLLCSDGGVIHAES